MIRLFIAIDLPESIKYQVRSLCFGLNGVKWTRAEQMHLTIRFIGEVDGFRLDDIALELSKLRDRSLILYLKGVGFFPPTGDPKVLWAGLAHSDKLEKLYRKINRALMDIGLKSEHRNFAPHITLGRIRSSSINDLQDFFSRNAFFKTEEFSVEQYHLYSSRLTPGGAIHEKLASFPLDQNFSDIKNRKTYL